MTTSQTLTTIEHEIGPRGSVTVRGFDGSIDLRAGDGPNVRLRGTGRSRPRRRLPDRQRPGRAADRGYRHRRDRAPLVPARSDPGPRAGGAPLGDGPDRDRQRLDPRERATGRPGLSDGLGRRAPDRRRRSRRHRRGLGRRRRPGRRAARPRGPGRVGRSRGRGARVRARPAQDDERRPASRGLARRGRRPLHRDRLGGHVDRGDRPDRGRGPDRLRRPPDQAAPSLGWRARPADHPGRRWGTAGRVPVDLRRTHRRRSRRGRGRRRATGGAVTDRAPDEPARGTGDREPRPGTDRAHPRLAGWSLR